MTWLTRTGTHGKLDENRKAAWCYVALGVDKLINRNSLLSRWNPNKGKETVEATFDSHDFRNEVVVRRDGRRHRRVGAWNGP